MVIMGVIVMTAGPGHQPDFDRAAEQAETRAELTEARIELAEARDTIANLEIALQTSREIGMAIGILMASHRVTHEQAFGLLRTASQNHNVKLRDLADGVILTGTIELANDCTDSTPPHSRPSGRQPVDNGARRRPRPGTVGACSVPTSSQPFRETKSG